MLLGALALASALAATPPRRALPPVQVTADAAEAAVTAPGTTRVLDADAIRRAGPMIDASEVLSRLPGVIANNRGNYAQDLQVSIRGYGARAGFGVRGLRLYVNGIPASAPDGQGQISNVALAAADRIEVVSGPLAALYGNGGGVIKISAEPGSRSAGSAARFANGTDLRRYGAGTHGGDEAFGWQFDASRFETDGQRPHSAARRELFDGVAAWSLPADWRLAATMNALDAPLAEDPLGLSPADFARDPDSTNAAALAFDTRKRTRQAQVGASIARDSGSSRGARLAVYGGRRTIEQFLAVPIAAQAAPTSAGGVVDLARDYGGAEWRVWQDFEPAGGWLRLTAGLDSDRVTEDRRGYENFVGSTLGVRGRMRRDEHNRIDRTDLLLQADWQPAPDWQALLGWRRNRVDFRSADRFIAPGNPDDSGRRRYRANVPAAGLRWSPAGPWSAHAAIARGFESPTANELAYRADGAPGFNFALRPSRSLLREIGLRRVAGGSRFEVALFNDSTRDEIVVARAQGGRSAFRNGGSVRRRGVELSLSQSFGTDWTLDAAWTWLDARFTSGTPACELPPCPPGAQAIEAGSRLPALPPRFGSLALRWAPQSAWQAQFELRGADGVFADDGNRLRAPAYALANLALRREWAVARATLSLDVRIDNLADRRHVASVIVNDANGRVFEPDPGRRILFDLGLEW